MSGTCEGGTIGLETFAEIGKFLLLSLRFSLLCTIYHSYTSTSKKSSAIYASFENVA